MPRIGPYGNAALSKFRRLEVLIATFALIIDAASPRNPNDRGTMEGNGLAGFSIAKLWMDAYLAAFAASGRPRFVTTDEGFKQFTALRLILLTRAEDPSRETT